MRYGSLFSGVGGLDLGMDRAGLACAWQAEIDEQCRSVLARHWPDVPKFGDVRTCGVRKEVQSELSPVDVIVAGFP